MKYLYWQDADCVAFGYEIFRLLGLDNCCYPESQEGKAERGTFTKWLYVNGRTGDFEAARAKGLRIAARIQEDGILDEMIRGRYASYDSGIGARIEAGTTSFRELEKWVLENGDPEPRSGKQEKFESILAGYL